MAGVWDCPWNGDSGSRGEDQDNRIWLAGQRQDGPAKGFLWGKWDGIFPALSHIFPFLPIFGLNLPFVVSTVPPWAVFFQFRAHFVPYCPIPVFRSERVPTGWSWQGGSDGPRMGIRGAPWSCRTCGFAGPRWPFQICPAACVVGRAGSMVHLFVWFGKGCLNCDLRDLGIAVSARRGGKEPN